MTLLAEEMARRKYRQVQKESVIKQNSEWLKGTNPAITGSWLAACPLKLKHTEALFVTKSIEYPQHHL